MFDYLYEWLQNISFYLILVTAVLQAVPNQEYRKYIRFFTGLVLILMLLAPILDLFGSEVRISEIYEKSGYEEQLREFEVMQEQAEDIEQAGGEQTEGIGVEEIRIE